MKVGFARWISHSGVSPSRKQTLSESHEFRNQLLALLHTGTVDQAHQEWLMGRTMYYGLIQSTIWLHQNGQNPFFVASGIASWEARPTTKVQALDVLYNMMKCLCALTDFLGPKYVTKHIDALVFSPPMVDTMLNHLSGKDQINFALACVQKSWYTPTLMALVNAYQSKEGMLTHVQSGMKPKSKKM